MKVILNEDVKHLGELGDVKDVAAGYARNYLFPRGLALPCNAITLSHFAARKAEIEERKAQKRKDAASLKEKLSEVAVTLIMPCGANGKLYGAVTNQTIADELTKLGFDIERKRIDVPGLTIKSTGKYFVAVRLYESEAANLSVVVKGQEEAKAEAAAEAEKAAAEKVAAEKAAAESPAEVKADAE